MRKFPAVVKFKSEIIQSEIGKKELFLYYGSFSRKVFLLLVKRMLVCVASFLQSILKVINFFIDETVLFLLFLCQFKKIMNDQRELKKVGRYYTIMQ